MCSSLKKEALIKSSTSKIIMHCNISLFYCLVMLHRIYFWTLVSQLKKINVDIGYFFICNKTLNYVFVFSFNNFFTKYYKNGNYQKWKRKKTELTKSGNGITKNLKRKIRGPTYSSTDTTACKKSLQLVREIGPPYD